MNAEIICVGTELLLGDVVNTNASFLAKSLADKGIFCYYQSVVGDNAGRLNDLLKQAMSRSKLIIITGGLGPTYDDMTKETVAEVLGKELIFDDEILSKIKAIFAKSERPMTENNKKQAYVIEGAEVLDNDNGTAPGLFISTEDNLIVLLPGPPREMKLMYETKLQPKLEALNNIKLVSKKVYMTEIGESYVEEILKKEMLEGTNPTIAPYALEYGLMLRVTATSEDEDEANRLIEPVINKINNLFHKYIYSINNESIEDVVVNKLIESNLKVAIAESCTGGLLAERIISIPDSSKVIDLGLVTYSNSQKIDLLGVDAAVITNSGAVSEEVALQMANRVKALGNADIGVGITGIAGPSTSESKPVGLVYVAVVYGEKVVVKKLNLSRGYTSERTRIRRTSTTVALKMILDIMNSDI